MHPSQYQEYIHTDGRNALLTSHKSSRENLHQMPWPSSDFQDMAPSDFFSEHFGSWGNISVKVEDSKNGETEIKLTKEQFTNFLL